MEARTADPAVGGLRFTGEWRRYQTLALEAFDRDVAAGRPKTHIVAPPGSGKTFIGLELVRRLGERALVLVPNTAIQAQWPKAAAAFGAAPGTVAPDPGAPVAVLTYQALTQLEDPSEALRRVAENRWAEERAQVSGEPAGEIARSAAAWTGEAAERRDRQVARITAALKREIARGEHASLRLADLFSPGARERIDALRESGVRTVVLDECHHLASLWGYVVQAVVELLGGPHVIGLTATPPDLTDQEEVLYAALLGDVDFTVPTPAVVRDGFLAPYQELAWLTAPLDSERQWLAEHDLRFEELVTRLHDEPGGDTMGLPAWLTTRLRRRTLDESTDAEVSWPEFQRSRPKLARAGVRFLASAGLPLPPGAPRGEGFREQPNLDDWLVLLEDYALHCLAADPSTAAASRYDAIAAALRELGFQLTRRGIRRGASEVDRLLTVSAAKPIALASVIRCELDARGEALRALVLTDTELGTRRADDALTGVLDPEAGSAIAAVRALAEDALGRMLRPLLVTGRGLRCAPADAPAILEALAHAAPDLRDWQSGAEDGGVVELTAGPRWEPRVWVAAATRAFHDGGTRVLVGTRTLLGEGWDAPCVNCLVDLTAATTAVSVPQMRGRSLRLDPEDPDKIASNWDVVCVAPELLRGTADYARFVRKHLHVFAPCEDGAIEAGPSHVHPALGPFAPPPETDFAQIDRELAARAADHRLARERWQIGTPYVAAVAPTLVVRPRAPGGAGEPAAYEPPSLPSRPPRYPTRQRTPLAVAAAATGVAAIGVVAAPVLLAGLAVVPLALAWSAWRLRRARRALPVLPPLERIARVVADSFAALGELSADATASLQLEPRASGYLRCSLTRATPDEQTRFAGALAEAIAPAGTARYVISRLVAVPGRSFFGQLTRILFRRPPFDRVWHAVPDVFGARKERAEVFAAAWRRWLGPSELRFTQRTDEGREALAEAGAAPEAWETQLRDVWS